MVRGILRRAESFWGQQLIATIDGVLDRVLPDSASMPSPFYTFRVTHQRSRMPQVSLKPIIDTAQAH
jgi:hypothetical protein